MLRLIPCESHSRPGQHRAGKSALPTRLFSGSFQEAKDNIKEGKDVMELRKLNSFIKESMRFSPIGLTSVGRKCMAPHTFKDGTYVPRGVVVWSPLDPICHDPEIFTDPETFEGCHFLKLRDLGKAEDKKWQLAPSNEEWLAFGYGAQSCPGRYFAEKVLSYCSNTIWSGKGRDRETARAARIFSAP